MRPKRGALPCSWLSILGLFKLAAVGLVVYLTYFFTTMFAHRTPPPAPLSDEQIALAKKAEDLRARERRCSRPTAGLIPVTKSKLRIPIDRAMELYLAESHRPPAPPAAVPGPTATPAAPAGQTRNRRDRQGPRTPRPRPGAGPPRLPPECPRSKCIAWSAWPVTTPTARARSSAWPCPPFPISPTPSGRPRAPTPSSLHSILEGKESTVNGVKIPLMLPMKDKLALAHTDVKDMVAFMRAFKDGKQVVSATPGGMPASRRAGHRLPGDQHRRSAPTPAPPPSPPTTIGTDTTRRVPLRRRQPRPASRHHAIARARRAGRGAALHRQRRTGAGRYRPPALPASTVDTAAQAEKIRAAGATFNTLCIACHGAGRARNRGAGRHASHSPTSPRTTGIPAKSNSQLATSILEGKGLDAPLEHQADRRPGPRPRPLRSELRRSRADGRDSRRPPPRPRRSSTTRCSRCGSSSTTSRSSCRPWRPRLPGRDRWSLLRSRSGKRGRPARCIGQDVLRSALGCCEDSGIGREGPGTGTGNGTAGVG